MKIGSHTFDLAGPRPLVMGILNVTPDSFSDGGRYDSVDAAVRHALAMISDGCDIIDIGAESTRPGHVQISTDEECTRLLPSPTYPSPSTPTAAPPPAKPSPLAAT